MWLVKGTWSSWVSVHPSPFSTSRLLACLPPLSHTPYPLFCSVPSLNYSPLIILVFLEPTLLSRSVNIFHIFFSFFWVDSLSSSFSLTWAILVSPITAISHQQLYQAFFLSVFSKSMSLAIWSLIPLLNHHFFLSSCPASDSLSHSHSYSHHPHFLLTHASLHDAGSENTACFAIHAWTFTHCHQLTWNLLVHSATCSFSLKCKRCFFIS